MTRRIEIDTTRISKGAYFRIMHLLNAHEEYLALQWGVEGSKPQAPDDLAASIISMVNYMEMMEGGKQRKPSLWERFWNWLGE